MNSAKVVHGMSPEEALRRISEIRRDPVAFLRAVRTRDEVDKTSPIKAFPIDRFEYLRLYARLWAKERFVAVPKSRRMMMSWTNVALFVWDTMFNQGRANAFVSKKEDDSDELVRRARFIVENLDPEIIPLEFVPKHEYRYGKLSFPEIESTIQGFASGADQLRQYTFSGILGDEMAFWENAQKMYAASFPTLEGGGRFSAISSPGPGFFRALVFDALESFTGGSASEGEAESAGTLKHNPVPGVEVWRNARNGFVVFQLHFTANPDKRDPDYITAVRGAMPRAQFEQEYNLQWDSFSGLPVYQDFDDARHVAKEKPEPETGLPLLRGWDFGLCYDDETEVLTESGWKLFRDVGESERVASMDPETFELRYEAPKLRVDLPYDGDMITWDSQTLQACVTPDHVVPVWDEESKELRKYYAKDLLGQGHNLIRMTARWNGRDTENPLGLSPKLFGAFMGAYLSEGSIDGRRVVLYQSDANKSWMREILRATEWDWREIPGGFRLYDARKAEYLSGFGLAGDKYIPDAIRFGSTECIAEFIRAYTLGDGHVRIRPNGSEEHTIYSKSKRMADGLSELALKLGWYSSITRIKATTSYYEAEDRWITSAPGWNVRFKKTSDWSHLRGAKKTVSHYTGRVYCLSVASGMLYVRKNGRPHWNGNTPACVIAQLQGQTLVVLKEFTAQNMGAERFVDLVLPQIRAAYPAWSDQRRDWFDFIDPAGEFRKDTDEGTCAKVLDAAGLTPIPGPVAFEARRKAVETFLVKRTRQGEAFQIDKDACPVTYRGFKGGYRFPEKAMDVEPTKLRPIKDEHSHPHDALQYICAVVTGLKRPSEKAVPQLAYFNNRGSSG